MAGEITSIGIRVNAVTSCPVETNSLSLEQVPEPEMEYKNLIIYKYFWDIH